MRLTYIYLGIFWTFFPRYLLAIVKNWYIKTYVMLLASTGLRATEVLSIRLKDLDMATAINSNNNSSPTKLIIRGEFTKTKVDRFVFLTRKVLEQIKIWLDYKYRKRRICYKDKETGKTITEYKTPEKIQNEFRNCIRSNNSKRVFTIYHLAHFLIFDLAKDIKKIRF